jgi:mannose-6-phosphate isomerase
MVPVATGPGVASLTASIPGPWLMDNPVRAYDWGCPTSLARIQGRPPSGGPEAELWMGAHPSAPSRLYAEDTGFVDIPSAIEASPEAILGARCVEQFGARLPFLLKVLAVRRALSIQVHPSPAQAAAGFAREQAAGTPPDRRSYVDPFAKPEMLVAVSAFVALAGLRPRASIEHLTRLLALPELRVLDTALAAYPGESGPVQVFAGLATLAGDRRAKAAAAIRRRATDLLAAGAHDTEDDRLSLEWVLRLAEQHGGDPLILAPLLLRLHRLAPGDALFLPPGVPHAYLEGVGAEVMGSSDNVVRGGLTTKRIDASALVDLLDPHAAPLAETAGAAAETAGAAGAAGPAETRWQPPVPEFALSRIMVDGPQVPLSADEDLPEGPQVLLCLEGEVTITSPVRSVRLRGGRSAFLAASGDRVSLTGRGVVFRATTGRSSRTF